MKTLQESIIGRKGVLSPNKELQEHDVVEIAGGSYFMVIKDPHIWKLTDCKAPWDDAGYLYSYTKGGQPDPHNFLYLKNYIGLDYFIGGKYKDPMFSIIRIWRPKTNLKIAVELEMDQMERAVKSGRYIKVYER